MHAHFVETVWYISWCKVRLLRLWSLSCSIHLQPILFSLRFLQDPPQDPIPYHVISNWPSRRQGPASRTPSSFLCSFLHFSFLSTFRLLSFFPCWYFPRNVVVVCQILVLFVRRWRCRYLSSSACTYSSCWWSRSFHLHRLWYLYLASTSSSPWFWSPSGIANFLSQRS